MSLCNLYILIIPIVAEWIILPRVDYNCTAQQWLMCKQYDVV